MIDDQNEEDVIDKLNEMIKYKIQIYFPSSGQIKKRKNSNPLIDIWVIFLLKMNRNFMAIEQN